MLSLEQIDLFMGNNVYLELFTFSWIIMYSLELVIFSKTIIVIFITSYFFMKKPCNVWNLYLFYVNSCNL